MKVQEGGSGYRPGGCTVEGCVDADLRRRGIPAGGGIRIVWHHKASDQTRTFTVSYRVEDALVAYSDVLDLEWQVWGDQWDFDLDSLTASLGNPASTRPTRATASGASRGTSRARLRAIPGSPCWRRATSARPVRRDATVPRTPQQGWARRPGEGEACRRSWPRSRRTTTSTTRPSTGRSAGSQPTLADLAAPGRRRRDRPLSARAHDDRAHDLRAGVPARAAGRRPAGTSPTGSPRRAETAPTPCSRPCSTSWTAATTRRPRPRPRTRSSTWPSP